ncbi:MAG: DUF3493 domain-containing protein [Cyanobacterium sp. T60_A2020_053]|nr:DUF3493 domain-containing protein [Cyanobacterium sp. T60_A2020_053]
MNNKQPKKDNSMNGNQKNLTPEKYAYLKAEAQAPYRGLRKFIYFGFGASGAIGAFIFFVQLLAGKNVQQNLPNLLIQISIISLMVFLFRWENRQVKK